MTLTSSAARAAVLDPYSPEVFIALLEIDCDALAEPVRISTDPTERWGSAPLRYGTRALGYEWVYAGIGVTLPATGDEASTSVPLTIDIVSPEIAELVKLTLAPARVTLRLVTRSTPDVVEGEWRRMEAKVGTADQDAGTVVIEVQRIPVMDEPTVLDRLTVDKFPGLHKR